MAAGDASLVILELRLLRRIREDENKNICLAKITQHIAQVIRARTETIRTTVDSVCGDHVLGVELNVYCQDARWEFGIIIQRHCVIDLDEPIWIGPWSSNVFPHDLQIHNDKSGEDGCRFYTDISSFDVGGLSTRKEFISRCSTGSYEMDYQTIDFEFDKGEINLTFEKLDDLSERRATIKLESLFIDILVHNVRDTSLTDIYLQVMYPPLLSEREDAMEDDRFIRVPDFQDFFGTSFGDTTTIRLRLENETATKVLTYFWLWEYQVFWTNVRTCAPPKPLLPTLGFSNFECHWSLRVLWCRGAGVQHQLRNCTRQSFPHCDEHRLSLAMCRVAEFLDSYPLLDVLRAIREYCESGNILQEDVLPKNCYFVRRIVQTPTRTLFFKPSACFQNRILRNFDSDYCVRISYRDENWDKLRTPILVRHTVMAHTAVGYSVQDRKFQFLACSNSQIRDHGLWLYAKDSTGITAERIRDWMGDLTGIDCVPKYMARMGQCFSQSEDTVGMSIDDGVDVQTLPDITGGYCPETFKPYTFSDGVGKISKELIAEAQIELNKSRDGVRQPLACALQVRYSGSKGMLVLDPTLPGKSVHLRESMRKFSSRHNRLEIMRLAKPIRLYLNRQVVTLLEFHGVPQHVFIKLQDQMLHRIAYMMLFEERATNALCSMTSTDIFRYRDLRDAGVSMTTEPFFRSLLFAVSRSIIRLLVAKAHIELPLDSSRNLMGVLDETATLEYGQVFIQISKSLESPGMPNLKVVSGTVVVSKMPAHHPGDIRKFEAVDIPQLHHLYDVIVFPQKGERPHPNEMSGADLDGDEYFVTWHKDLIFPGANHTPMNFPAGPKTVHRGVIHVTDMLNFMIDYVSRDKLGVLANRHLVLADRFGVNSQQCLDLAKIISYYVDFPKSGYAPGVNMFHYRVLAYPDFMQKEDHFKTYKSNKALGKLYRECRMITRKSKRDGEYYDEENPEISIDSKLIFQGYEDYIPQAKSDLAQYESKLQTILQQYGIVNEGEAFSGCISQIHNRFKGHQDRMETESLTIANIEELVSSTRREFAKEFGVSMDVLANRRPTRKVYSKASAWYYVCYSRSEPQYLSFPWIIGDLLCKLIPAAHAPSYDPEPALSALNKEIRLNFYKPEVQSMLSGVIAKLGLDRSMHDAFVLGAIKEFPRILPCLGLMIQWLDTINMLKEFKEDEFLAIVTFALISGKIITAFDIDFDMKEASEQIQRKLGSNELKEQIEDTNIMLHLLEVLHLLADVDISKAMPRQVLATDLITALRNISGLNDESTDSMSYTSQYTISNQALEKLHSSAVRSLHYLSHRPQLSTLLERTDLGQQTRSRRQRTSDSARLHIPKELWIVLSQFNSNLKLEKFLLEQISGLQLVKIRRDRSIRGKVVGILFCKGDAAAVHKVETLVVRWSEQPREIENFLHRNTAPPQF